MNAVAAIESIIIRILRMVTCCVNTRITIPFVVMWLKWCDWLQLHLLEIHFNWSFMLLLELFQLLKDLFFVVIDFFSNWEFSLIWNESRNSSVHFFILNVVAVLIVLDLVVVISSSCCSIFFRSLSIFILWVSWLTILLILIGFWTSIIIFFFVLDWLSFVVWSSWCLWCWGFNRWFLFVAHIRILIYIKL